MGEGASCQVSEALSYTVRETVPLLSLPLYMHNFDAIFMSHLALR